MNVWCRSIYIGYLHFQSAGWTSAAAAAAFSVGLVAANKRHLMWSIRKGSEKGKETSFVAVQTEVAC